MASPRLSQVRCIKWSEQKQKVKPSQCWPSNSGLHRKSRSRWAEVLGASGTFSILM